MKYAVVFPGQGSQAPEMLAELAQQHPIVEQTFTEASEVLGYDLLYIIRHDERLQQTEYTQPAMLAAGIAAWRVWCQQDLPPPAFLAGHSLGEYTALVAADVLSFTDAVGLVAERGRLMQMAVPTGEGAMAAVLGLEDTVVQAMCAAVTDEQQIVEAVNYNSPGQVVIAGHTSAVEQAMQNALDQGAKRAVRLPVSVPAHSSLLQHAAAELAQRIASVPLSSPTIPVLHNVDAAEHTETGAIAQILQQQLHSPVRWTDTIRVISAAGVQTVLECGPGKVLLSLGRRIDKQLQLAAVDSPSGLAKAVQLLSSVATKVAV